MVIRKFRSALGMAGSATARDSLIFFIGNFANTALSFIAVIIVSRHLGPSSFGILAVFNTFYVLIIALTDLGLNTTSIRLVSQYRKEDPKKAAITMNVIVRIEFFVGVLILITGSLFARPIANLVGGQDYLTAVRAAFLAGAFASAAAFFGPFFVAYRQYVRNAVLNFASFVLRTGAVLVMLAGAALSLNRVIAVYTLVPIIFFGVGLWFIPHDFFVKTKKTDRSSAYQDVIHYSKWIFLSLAASGAISRLDLLFLTRYHGAQQAGYYYAAQQLITIMPLIITALSTVLLQRISQLDSSQFGAYLKRAFGGILVLGIFMLPVLLLAPYLFQVVFGNNYASSAGPFRLLFLAQLVLLLVIPLNVKLLRIGQPAKITLATAVQFLVSISLYIALIPSYGMTGAAGAILAGSVASAIILFFFAMRPMRGKSQELVV